MDSVSWAERFELFLWPILSAVAAGLVVPWVGGLLHVRRTSFQAIVLPQSAAAGVVFSYAILGWWIETLGLGGLTLDEALADPHAASTFSLLWGAGFTAATLAALAGARRGGATELARAAALFALASALIVVFGTISPFGRGEVDDLLQGKMLGINEHHFEVLAAALGLSALLLAWFGREILLVSYDRDTAIVLGLRATLVDLLFHGIVGLTVAAATLTLGPVLLFGLLVLPPLAARPFAHSMRSFHTIAAGLGVASVLLGIVLSFEWDLPLGPAVVVAASLLLLPTLARR